MRAKENQDGSQDPPLGGLSGLPAYPEFVPTVAETEEVAAEPVLSRRRFLHCALVTALTIPPVATAAGLGYVGFFGEDPEERARRYRSPRMGEPVILGTRERYPYSRSALRIFAEEEVRLTPDRFDYVAELCTIADNIADQVAVRMKDAHGNDSVTEALRVAGESEAHLLQYASAIAAELRHSGCFYYPEESLADAVDPVHPRPWGAAYHLDCDLLCLVALHCASRHDVPFHAVVVPGHMYLGSPAFPELAVEMTAFRGEMTGIRLGRGLRLVPQWDAHPAFSSSHDTQRASHSMSEGELQEAAIGSVLYEMAEHAGRDGEKLRRILRQAERECARGLPGKMIFYTRNYIVWKLEMATR
ncbi:hypothetical protein HYS30_02595 [Candidatus Peregrinibacteria bacterium]|nr:hypothetical protein [Candidatus Peregrinibacteria bacterium]